MEIDHYSFTVRCDVCESKVEQVSDGGWGTKERTAVVKCLRKTCGLSWVIGLHMTPVGRSTEVAKKRKEFTQ